jgi:hypothetical protein
MDFVNIICPNCKNPNYMVLLGDFSKVYKYKCMNCNRYFNDIDFEEPLQPVWKMECMNTKVDMVEVVRCKDCRFRQSRVSRIIDGKECNLCEMIKGYKPADWYCADGERKKCR